MVRVWIEKREYTVLKRLKGIRDIRVIAHRLNTNPYALLQKEIVSRFDSYE